MKIKVVLMDSDGVVDHASGYLDPDDVGNATLLERHKRIYTFNKLQDGVVFYREVDDKPYVITEW